jgi:hypothetical protein
MFNLNQNEYYRYYQLILMYVYMPNVFRKLTNRFAVNVIFMDTVGFNVANISFNTFVVL